MIDLNPYLKKYNDDIKLSSTREDQLRISRDAIDDAIARYFENNNKKKPTFKGQGSFTMKTTINPKDTDDGYDIDYGVYINTKDIINEGDEGNYDNWVKPSTVHDWIYKAVENQTSRKPENKNKCIRVKYAPGETSYSYHIDLPVYVENNDKYYLAIKNDNKWAESDPRAIIDWFRDELAEKGEEYRVIVRFLKSWSKLQSWNCTKPTGLILTILVSNEFVQQEDGVLDLSLYETLQKMIKYLELQLSKPEYDLSNPVAQEENLLKDYSKAAMIEFKEKLQRLYDSFESALESDTEDDAFKHLRKCFSDINYLENTAKTESSNYAKTLAPASIGDDGRSA